MSLDIAGPGSGEADGKKTCLRTVPSPKGPDHREKGEGRPSLIQRETRGEERKGKRSMYVYIQGGNTPITERTAGREDRAEGDDREQKNEEEEESK